MSLKAAQGDTISLGIGSCQQEFTEGDACEGMQSWLAMLFEIVAAGFSAHAICSKTYLLCNGKLNAQGGTGIRYLMMSTIA
jgi:hypothetical protein